MELIVGLVYPLLSTGDLFCRNQTHYHIQFYWYGTAQLQGKHQTHASWS